MSSEAGRFYPFGDDAANSIRSLGMSEALSRNWWLVGLRGILAVAFGLFTIFMPGVTMLSLVLVFAAYMVVDGGFTIGSAIRAAQRHERWVLLLLQGILSIAAGVIAVIWPGITVLAFVLLVAAWALVSGGTDILLSFRLKQEHGRIWLALAVSHPSSLGTACDRAHHRRGSSRLVDRHLRADFWRRAARACIQTARPAAGKRSLRNTAWPG